MSTVQPAARPPQGPRGPVGAAAVELDALLDGRERVDVRTLGPDALLARRHDVKAVVDHAAVEQVLTAVPAGWQVATAGASVRMPYHTVYFDGPDLDLFRDHRQGRLRRLKVRTRRYEDGTTLLEVKLRGPKRLAEKPRRPHHAHGQLGPDDLAWIADVVRDRLGRELPEALAPSAWTAYERTVLRSPDGTERLTLDLALTTGHDGHAAAPATAAIVELKSLAPRSSLLPVLHRAGSRPVRLSKYALAVNAAHHVAANRWRPAARRLGRAG